MNLLIIGGGPAGLTAGIYSLRFGLSSLLLESQDIPSSATLTSNIENIPGIPAISGFDFINKIKEQARSLGVKFEIATVKKIVEKDTLWEVQTEDKTYTSFAIIIATGHRAKKLNIPGEERLIGRGVSYCAVCDAPFFADKNVVVVGGGNSSLQEALFLSNIAKKVIIVHRRDEFRASEILQNRVFSNKKIEIKFSSVVDEIIGDNRVRGIKLKNLKTDKVVDIECDGLFVFIGFTPNTEFVKDLLFLDENGYIVCDEQMRTSKRGIFSAGDVREKLLRQVTTACSDGAIAAYSAYLYLKEKKSHCSLLPF